MRYIGPKRKLCRREKKNLFGTPKYNLKRGDTLPGQHGSTMPRLSEYGILLRNKQALKRMYGMSEKQFANLVTKVAKVYAKNKNVAHDVAVLQFLERRCDVVLLRAWFAKTIMQARQMISHGHWMLNGKKHNIPSAFLSPEDVLQLRKKLHTSTLYTDAIDNKNIPFYLEVDKNKFSVKLLQLPHVDSTRVDVDVLKVIEFYARW